MYTGFGQKIMDVLKVSKKLGYSCKCLKFRMQVQNNTLATSQKILEIAYRFWPNKH